MSDKQWRWLWPEEVLTDARSRGATDDCVGSVPRVPFAVQLASGDGAVACEIDTDDLAAPKEKNGPFAQGVAA